MEPEERFARIEALLHAMAERENQMEIRFNHRMEQSDRRMERLEKRSEEAEKRMEKFDLRLEATRQLVRAGVKMVMKLGKQHAELEKSLQAFVDSMKKGGNGNGRWRA